MDPYRRPFPFDAYRRLRYPGPRPRCVHCGARHTQSWGSYSGRRRYRCVPCGRTFSDFTRTPIAHLKLVDRWPAFCRCILARRTVRDTARILGISPSTAFRWRHRLLRHMHQNDRTPLGQRLVVDETWFPYSRKGERSRGPYRGPDSSAPLRPAGPQLRQPGDASAIHGRSARAWVVAVQDDTGRVASGFTGLTRPRVEDLEAILRHRLGHVRQVGCRFGSMGAAGILAARRKWEYRRVRAFASRSSPFQHLLFFRRWLRPFRGVATRYLDHYLTWHRFVRAIGDPAAGRRGPGVGDALAQQYLLMARFP